MDLRPLLESLGSSSQIVKKALRQSIASLKQLLEDDEVERYSWIEGTEIVADILTKVGSKRKALEEIVKDNILSHAQNKDNVIMYENVEIIVKNLTIKKN